MEEFEPPAAGGNALSGLDVLVVGGGPDSRSRLRRFLTSLVASVREAGDGAEGLEAFAARPSGAVLVDISHPGMGGLEMVRRIRSESRDMPVIILADDPGAEEMRQALRLGVRDCLLQPVSGDDLLAALAQAANDNPRREAGWRMLADHPGAGLSLRDGDGRLRRANRAFCDILGFDSPEEAVDTLRNIDQQLYASPGRSAEVAASAEPMVSQVYGRDGDALWVSESLRPVEVDGRTFLQGVMVDVTSAREAEESLSATLRMFQKVLDTTPDAVVVLDTEHQVILANDAFAADLGLDKEDALGLPVEEFLTPLADEDDGRTEGSHLDAFFHSPREHNLVLSDASGMLRLGTLKPFYGEDDDLLGALLQLRKEELTGLAG
ncbi:PAS domain S-box protein [Desulfohalovibrio reitneri]|uniref:PAS domain S-box protein n=1 Tax=Desulfohalovibrio reitneri TaxID=1307759 RepID=UPI0004A73F61|nr:PAS domain S-box protein [Desulfohalovibrio reitneri]